MKSPRGDVNAFATVLLNLNFEAFTRLTSPIKYVLMPL